MDANADIEQKTVNYRIPLWMAEMRSSYYMRRFMQKDKGLMTLSQAYVKQISVAIRTVAMYLSNP